MTVHGLTFLTITTLLGNVKTCFECSPPHIILILADDMGFNDVSFHGSPQIPTPNLDAMAAGGVIIHRYYAAPQCTPSRASLMTGKYSINTGLQHWVIFGTEPTGLPLEIKTMPEHFRNLGYATHMVGKWHLGFYKTVYTPTYRGFDSFFGYWNGHLDYYDYTHFQEAKSTGENPIWGIDIHNNTETVRGIRGNYSMDVFTKVAVKVIEQHNASQPLFLYFSSQACHTGNSFMPLQVPPERVARYSYIKDPNRRLYAGLVSSLDDAVGEIVRTLDSTGMLDNSIIVFIGDNGGETNGEHGGQASNWPLRAMKLYTFEGGVRVPAAIWSPLLKLKRPRTAKHLMHVSDWLPTLYRAAGGNVEDLGKIDGYDMWDVLMHNSNSPRREIMLQIDPFYGMSALIRGKYKLINGTYPDENDLWYGPSGREDVNPYSMDTWVWRNGSVVKSIFEKSGNWLLKIPDTWRKNAIVNCGKRKNPPHGNGGCNPTRAPCLFNIENDPCEYHNIANHYPKIVNSMLNRIRHYNRTGYDSISKPVDPHGDPRCHGFQFVPWQDEEYLSDCPWLD